MFITLEGGEGVSKSTQSKMLSQYLFACGVDNILTREPGGTPFGEQFRDLVLQTKLNAKSELLAMMAARSEHICQVIAPALQQGKVVICDRFIDSTACYQTQNNDIDIEMVYDLHHQMFGNLLPSLTILLDLDPQIATQRVIARAMASNQVALDKNESNHLDYHIAIRAKYKLLAEKFADRIKVVQAAGSPQEIHLKIATLVNYYIKLDGL